MSDRPQPERTFVIGQATLTARAPEPALYLVATPIGNLADITIRALETLAAADIVACEDTRITRRLLERYAIRRKPIAYHEHNAAEAGPKLLAALKEGRSVALVSDAGTPLVSDPGFRLARQVLDADGKVVPIPGASAPLAGLVAPGLPSDSFFFAGFLPAKAGQRRTRLAALAPVPATLIFFESPRRLADTLAAMAEALGGSRQAAVCRELTKAYEEVRRGTLAELGRHYAEAGAPKGEVVVCVAPPADDAPHAPEDVDALLLELAAEMPAAKAAGEAARMTGGTKTDLYRRLIALRAEADGR
ncbi:MAG: 16S rRNA (cytidine(1402)-2'-O)-methyltransferase [Nitratireductor sp.]